MIRYSDVLDNLEDDYRAESEPDIDQK